MLGRQQIAGIPTALHELFKNAHDAYADHVDVDYFRKDSSLLLRDDGVGMTPDEFECRWLTLGTESKLGDASGIAPPYVDSKKPKRSVLGEKGIGRLAIAAIGRQVLVLSRAERGGKLHDLVVCFIHWGLFELPGLNLSDIEIPVEKWVKPGLPDESFVTALTVRVEKNLKSLDKQIPGDVRRRISKELAGFRIDPKVLYSSLGGPSLERGRGTHFFIHPVDRIIESDIDGSGEKDFAPPLQKNLVGFCNTMIPDAPVPPINIAFRDHQMDGGVRDLVDPSIEFFTPSDFKVADHHFEGTFDEYGQFSGHISIYGDAPIKYVLPWAGAKGKQTQCGPFSLKLAYVQGLQTETRLPPELYGPLTAKLDRIGGVYVYRDGVRILPYGNSDYDWLGIERRRSKSAKDYFFSYRRTFGVVQISRKDNSCLVEKAGREGFMENAAYRQMRDIAQCFLVEVAREHFRRGSEQAIEFWRVKDELERKHRLLEKREKRVAGRKKAFAAKLGNFFQSLESDAPSKETNAIAADSEAKLQVVHHIALTDPEEAGRQLLKLESTIKASLGKLRERYSITRPRGLGLTKNQLENWNSYVGEFAKIESDFFTPLEHRLWGLVTKAMSELAGAVDKRQRIDQALEEIRKHTESTAQRVRKETTDEAGALNQHILTAVRGHMASLQNALKEAFVAFERTDIGKLQDRELEELQVRLERDLGAAAAKEIGALESVRDQLTMLSEALANNESIADVTSALEDRAEDFKTQVDMYAEMAQIGTAVGIIQHEFSNTFSLMRNRIQQLRAWAATNPQLDEIYKHIRINFEHLDEYMNVFKPFGRRLQRTKVNIPGQEIRYYLMRLFEDRLLRHGIILKGTRAFDNAHVYAYPSTIYPCFVNLVDNSIYWLTKDSEGRPLVGTSRKEILLDADHNELFVSDTGPGVNRRVADRIFNFGYSRKKNGRGMGLYISREILRRDEFDLVLDNNNAQGRSTFRIVNHAINSEEETSG